MKLISLSLALLAATQIYAAAPSITSSIDESAMLAEDGSSSIYDANYSRRFIPYIKLGPGVTNLGQYNTVMPGLGLGFRSESNTSAVDCSFSGAFVETKDNESIFHFFGPKLLYLKYLNSHSPSALYVGFGSAWSSIQNGVTKQEFNGLSGVISAGIERNRSSRIRQIFQVDVNQPLLALRAGTLLPTPTLEASFSLGF